LGVAGVKELGVILLVALVLITLIVAALTHKGGQDDD
jgi:hypothetical protein